MTIAEMIEKRKALAAQAKAIIDEARAATRAMTAEEVTKYDGFVAEMEGLKATIEREQRNVEIEIEMRASVTEPVRPGTETEARGTKEQDEKRTAFIDHLRGENPEKRALTVGTHGTILLPTTLFDRIIEGVKMYGGVRGARVTVLPNVNGTVNLTVGNDTKKGHRVNASDAVASDPTSLATAPLTTYDYTSDIITIDRTLLSGSPLAVEAYLGTQLADRIARIVNEETTTGTGTGQPKGVLTAATLGATAATGTGITYDDLVELEHSVPAQFRANAQFMFRDTTLKALKKLKDLEGKPLWSAGIANAAPATIMGYSYVINDEMPALGLSAKPVLFGDFSRYFVADGPEMRVEVFQEMYKAKNQVGFVLFSSHGGTLGDSGSAIKYLQNAAA